MTFVLCLFVFLSIFFLISTVILIFENQKTKHIISRYMLENANLKIKLENEKKTPLPPVKTLTIEAQQILHDMTAHGHSVVRITPISPTDIFWRAPN